MERTAQINIIWEKSHPLPQTGNSDAATSAHTENTTQHQHSLFCWFNWSSGSAAPTCALQIINSSGRGQISNTSAPEPPRGSEVSAVTLRCFIWRLFPFIPLDFWISFRYKPHLNVGILRAHQVNFMVLSPLPLHINIHIHMFLYKHTHVWI